MATVNPAKVVGSSGGVLSSGKPADFVVLDKEFNVEMTIMKGKVRYTKDEGIIPS